MIQPHQVQNRRVNVVDVRTFRNCLQSDFVSLPNNLTAF